MGNVVKIAYLPGTFFFKKTVDNPFPFHSCSSESKKSLKNQTQISIH